VEQMREGGAFNLRPNGFLRLHVPDPLLEQPHGIGAIGGVNTILALLSLEVEGNCPSLRGSDLARVPVFPRRLKNKSQPRFFIASLPPNSMAS
jgi:hypothetical protein